MLNVTIVGSHDQYLEDAFKAAGLRVAAVAAADLMAVATGLSRAPDVIVIDLRGGMAIPQTLAVVKRQLPGTGIVIVAPVPDPGLLLEAMRAGVNEFVTAPIAPDDLLRAVARVAGQSAAVERGRVFAFVGAKGGVGTTTVAVNVAAVLGGLAAPGRSLLVDLHQAAGDAAVFVGAEPHFSVSDALRNTHRLDESFLRGLVTQVAPGLDLLAAPEAAADAIDRDGLRRLIDFVATVYRFVVLDVPRSDTIVLDALDGVGDIIIVANQELATVRGASRLAPVLRQRYGATRVRVVVSRSDRQADIGHGDIERAIGAEIAHTFPSDYRLALQALHKGRPLALDSHNPLSAAVKRFASSLAGIDERPAERPSGVLGLFSARR